MQTVALIVATCGDAAWAELARRRAVPSCAAQQPDELITLHRRAQDVCAARNHAALAAKTDWLLFVDADDELAPGYLQALYPHLGDQRRLLAPYVRYVRHDKGARMSTRPHIPNQGGWPETNEMVTGTAISNSLFRELGGWRGGFWPWSDWELWLRATKAGATHTHIAECVYLAHVNPNGENNTLRDPQALHARIKDLHREVWTE